MAIKEAEEKFPKLLLSTLLAGIESPDFSLPQYDNTPYAVLADLDLPIYLTTNYDHLMEAALISRRKEPVSEFCRWNDILNSKSDKPSRYKPTVAKPLVYHLSWRH